MYKALTIGAAGAIEGQAVRYGSPRAVDSYGDWFSPNTDLMLDAWGWPRPILWEHGVLPGTEGVVLGKWLGYQKRADGVYLHGQLDTRHAMYPTISADIQRGRYFLSSDSAPHLVKRRPTGNKTNELTRWAMLTASIVKNPAERRLAPLSVIRAAYESIGVKLGARNSARDKQRIQDAYSAATEIERLMLDLGAQPIGEPEPETDPLLAMPMKQRYILMEVAAIERELKIIAELEAIEAEYKKAVQLEQDQQTWAARLALYADYVPGWRG